MAKIAWENRDNPLYGWKVLSQGVCDGCALGVAGFHDWTIPSVHLCLTRLNLLRLNTMPALDVKLLADGSPEPTGLEGKFFCPMHPEIVRDEALAASGLLTRTIGGPSIRPPQPAGISELTYASAAKWNGPYLEKAVPLDPWGRPYLYRAPGGQGDFDIVSYGKDGQPGGTGDAADISSQ